ncbi:unnamed protein product [Linum tenue]|uniref:Uncharacterized protein n=1 Tax=Linum tenue TaxID=586396 RepID=A0AAV0QWL1_9ROSI|nr:unnamed protein product [Linum tenue]
MFAPEPRRAGGRRGGGGGMRNGRGGDRSSINPVIVLCGNGNGGEGGGSGCEFYYDDDAESRLRPLLPSMRCEDDRDLVLEGVKDELDVGVLSHLELELPSAAPTIFNSSCICWDLIRLLYFKLLGESYGSD